MTLRCSGVLAIPFVATLPVSSSPAGRRSPAGCRPLRTGPTRSSTTAFALSVGAMPPICTRWRLQRHPPSVLLLCTWRVFRLPLVDGFRNSGSVNDRRAGDLTRMLNRRQARMAERSGGLGHIVTPADRLAGIAHDPQHVGERQLTGHGGLLPHFLVCTAGRSLGAARARPFSTVSVHRAIARLIENRGPYVSVFDNNIVLQYGINPSSAARAMFHYLKL